MHTGILIIILVNVHKCPLWDSGEGEVVTQPAFFKVFHWPDYLAFQAKFKFPVALYKTSLVFKHDERL